MHVPALLDEMVFETPLDVAQRSFHHRDIVLAGHPAAKLIGQASRRLRRSSQNHYAGGRPIEAMNEAEKHIAGLVEALLQKCLAERYDIVITGDVGLSEHPRGLVDNEQVIVKMLDGQRHDADIEI